MLGQFGAGVGANTSTPESERYHGFPKTSRSTSTRPGSLEVEWTTEVMTPRWGFVWRVRDGLVAGSELVPLSVGTRESVYRTGKANAMGSGTRKSDRERFVRGPVGHDMTLEPEWKSSAMVIRGWLDDTTPHNR